MLEITENLLFIEAKGFSMWPFLKQTDKLIIKKVTIEDLMVGDAILYQTNNQIVCHRLLKKVRDRGRYLLYTRGDNSSSSLELISEKMLLGKAIGILRNGKMINLTGWKRTLINRSIVMSAPLVSWMARVIRPWMVRVIKPLYGRFRNIK